MIRVKVVCVKCGKVLRIVEATKHNTGIVETYCHECYEEVRDELL